MAPEVYTNYYDYRVDYYSIGATVFFVLVDHYIFTKRIEKDAYFIDMPMSLDCASFIETCL